MATTTLGAQPGSAGTAVQFSEPAAAGTSAPLGTSLLMGAFGWGKVGEVVEHSGRQHFDAVRGGHLREDPTPTCCRHFYAKARGAGKLLTYRVADGNQAASSLVLRGRNAPRSRSAIGVASPPTKVLTVSGLYPGRIGGQVAYYSGYLADRASAFDASAGTFATGVTMLTDRWKGATLSINGHAKTYSVTGNTTAGVLSIDVASGDSGPTGAGVWWLTMPATDAEGTGIGLAVAVKGSPNLPSSEFGLRITDRRVGAEVSPRYDSLSLNTTKASYVEQLVNKDGTAGRQHLITTDAEAVGSPDDSTMRPANRALALHPDSGVANVLTLDTVFMERSVSAGGNAWVRRDNVSYPASRIRCRAVLTFTAATTANVVFQDWEGNVLSSGFTVANSRGLTLGTAFNPESAIFPTFTVIAGSTNMASGDTVTVYFDPLPADLASKGGSVYVHAHSDSGTDIRTALAVVSNTATTITFASTTTLGATYSLVAPERPTILSDAETFDLSAGSLTFKYQINSESEVTLTTSLSGAATTAAALAADLTTQEASAHTPPRVQFEATAAGKLQVQPIYEWGADQTLTVTDGTINSALGISDDTADTGANGSVVAVSFVEDLGGGLDGIAELATSDYVTAWDVDTSPVRDIRDRDYGLIKCAMPGVSAATAQNAMTVFCDAYGYMARTEIAPANATSESTAVNWAVDNLAAKRNRSMAWDSYGYVRSRPFDGAEAAYPLTGAILGVEAALAKDRRGYHVAAAGPKVDIGDIFYALANTPDDTHPAPKDDALLNTAGIQAMEQRGATIYANGDENPEDAYVGRVWKHKVECILHIGHELRVQGIPAVWEPNDPIARARLVARITPLLRSKWDAGWFDRVSGEDFEDVVLIRAGDAENPPEVKVAGDLVCVVELTRGIVNTAKRVVFAIGTGGVAVSF